MAELRKLFALLLSSRRKYVDPSQAVGILRGSLGGENTAAYENNQQVRNFSRSIDYNTLQDVCEFTHKLLDWLEEAFKIRDVSQKGDVPMKEDPANTDNAKVGEEPMEAENLEKADAEKDSPVNVAISEGHRTGAVEKNPMYSLFYGQVGPYLLALKSITQF